MSWWRRLGGPEWVQNPDSWTVHGRRRAWILVTPPKVLPYFANCWHHTSHLQPWYLLLWHCWLGRNYLTGKISFSNVSSGKLRLSQSITHPLSTLSSVGAYEPVDKSTKISSFWQAETFNKDNCTVSQKTTQIWNGIARNYNDRFWWYLAEIFKSL